MSAKLTSTILLVLLATGAIAVCTNNDLRIYGNNPNQGALQICKSSTWYHVCGNSWSCNDARVACRQMGFTGPLAYYAHCCGYYGTINPRDNRRWYCSSTHQLKLSDCSYGISSLCSYYNYYYYYGAGIRCNPLSLSSYTAPTCSSNAEGDIRLQSGANEYEGRLEVCYSGRWSSVCNLDQHDAAVACKQLGHSLYSSVFTTGYGSSQSIIGSLTCQSSYNHLNECTINPYSACTTSTTLTLPTCSRAIRCTPYPDQACPEGAVRLADGQIEQEGRVEVCLGGVWGIICRYGWNPVDAYVACKQLGYDPGIAPATLYSQFGSSIAPVVYSYMNCMGFEKTLSQCSKTQYPAVTCPANYFVEVRCYEDCSDGDIRLTGGLTDAEGIVEICRGNLWGLVSEIDWSNSAAQVVCRQLGIESQNAMAVNNSHYERPKKSMHYSHVGCTGAEDRLTQCAKTSISLAVGKTTYINAPAAAVSCYGSPTTQAPCVPPSPPPSVPVCQNNMIRLMGGQASNEGRLEYCYNGQWSPFCTLRSQEATVACKQLGYTQYTGAAVMTDGQFGSVSNYSLFQNITCSSSATEAALGDCTMHEAINCLPSCPSIGIRCYTPGVCSEGAVRLMDGVIQQEGRIEVCMNGVWGSICDQAWDKTDAHILCQQLGYGELEPVAYHNSYFGAGYGPILYSNVSCGGYETSFAMCSKNEFLSFSCSRGHTAGLLCGEQCNDGEIRLVGGSTNLEGTVEICFGNLWGLISESGWGDHDAAATCRQLGFLGEGAVSYIDSHFGKPNKTIHASGVTCAGDEQTLTDCTLTIYPLEQGKMMASSVDVAGVSCQVYSPCAKVPPYDESNSCINDSIRLSGGAMSTEGRLEYCYQGSWTPLCSAGSKEASVACRQLGYTNYAWASVFTDGRFGTPNNMSYFQNVSCTGNELQLKECNLDDSCSSSCESTIGIRCYNMINDTMSCPAGAMRLVGGSVDKNGRVEVCLNGVWGTVCADGWGISDAFVACKQLGMGEGRPTSITNSSMFGEGSGPVVYSNVVCHGWESNIVECSKDLYGAFECPNTNVAGVICRDVCSAGDVRLVGGAVESEGTVEICSQSLWGLISATNWNDRNAGVVCRELGFQYSGAKAVVDSRFGKPSSFVHLTNVQCSGSEGALADCTASTITQGSSSLVDHINVAGIVCMSAAPSTSVLTMSSPRPSTSTITGTLSDLEMQLPLVIVVGVMAVLLVVGLIVIILLAIVVITKRKSATYGDKDQLIDTAGTLPVSNPAFDEDYEDMDNNEHK